MEVDQELVNRLDLWELVGVLLMSRGSKVALLDDEIELICALISQHYREKLNNDRLSHKVNQLSDAMEAMGDDTTARADQT